MWQLSLLLSRRENHPWLSEFEQKPPVYKFQEDNPLKDITSPLEEGLKRLAEGDLPSAVLLFEAEVQARPENARSWQLLGSTQADNEQDTAAIAALHKLVMKLKVEHLEKQHCKFMAFDPHMAQGMFKD